MKTIKRVCKGISGMILMLAIGTSTLNKASAQCTVQAVVTQNPGNCFSQVGIGSVASDPVQSWTYYIDGNIVGTNSSAFLNLEPGTYVASVVVITNQNCTAADDITFTVAGTVVTVDAGADIVACQETPLLSVSISSPNPYSIQWSPAYLLSDATSANPQIIQNVTNQWFIVDVIDDVTGCIHSDTITVTQQNPLMDSLDLCSGSATIDLGPGATTYHWLSFTDTAGNNSQLSYPLTQQSITVSEPGQYFMYANFPQCGALTSLVTVTPCNECYNFFTYNSSPQQCSETFQFVPGSSAQAVTYIWDFGDGSTSNDPNPTHIYTAGIYEVTLITMDIDQCVSTSTQTIYSTMGHSVSMSNDTIACQEAAYMEAFTYGGSGDFSYQWIPSTGLSNPTDSITYASGVHNQTYVCEVTDNLTGCTVGGSVTVSSYVAHFETLELCDDSVLVNLGPGGFFYNLSPLSLNQQQQSAWTDQEGQYVVYGQFPTCGAITSVFSVVACQNSCTSAITSTLNYQNCGALLSFVSSYSSPIDSAVWDFGNGNTFVQYGSQPAPQEFYSGGNYLVSLTAYHTGGCVSTTGYGITLLTDIEAVINAADTIACAGQLSLNATATGGGGQFAYYWPLSGGTAPSTVVVVSQNQWVVVEVTDTYTGCTAYDSIYVYANQVINETVELCNPAPVLTVDPGSLVYNWSVTNSSGNTTQLPNQTNALPVFNLGTYTCMTYYSGCQQVFHTFVVVACGTACSSDFIAVSSPLQCGSLYDFAGQNFTSATDSVVWNYGDGTTYTDNGGGETHFYTGGNYVVTMGLSYKWMCQHFCANHFRQFGAHH